MQAETYGWRVEVVSTPPRHASPCKVGTNAQALGMVVLLIGVLFAFVGRAWATNWQTVRTDTGTGYGLSFTLQLQIDLDSVNGTTTAIRTHITVTGSPTEGSNAYVAHTLWDGATPGSGTYLGGGNITSFPTDSTGAGSTLSVGQYRTFDANIQSTNPPTGQATVSYQIVADPATKKVKVSYFNNRDYPVTIRVVDTANHETVIAEMVVQPGTGVIQTVELPGGVNGATLLEMIDGFSQDGPTWIEDAEATTPVTNASTLTAQVTNPGTEPPLSTVTQTPNLPQNPPPPSTVTNTTNYTAVIMPRAQPPWTPRNNLPAPGTGGSDMTIVAYREGVDKLAKILEGEAQQPPDIGNTDAVFTAPPSTLNATAVSKLPTAPTLGTLAAASSVSFTLKFPDGHGELLERSFTVDFSQSPYASPIAVFRGALLVVLTLVYFIATFYAVRSAFAGK